MIGNDIVDLSAAKSASRALDDRYLGKICTVEEQRTIRESASPLQTLWRIWSMKESAYKIYQRTHRRQFYTPSKFECQCISAEQGLVRYHDFHCFTLSTITAAHIHTIAKAWPNDESYCDIIYLHDVNYNNQHRSAYARLQKLYANAAGVNAEDVVIKKDKCGIPEIYVKDERTDK